MDNNIFSGAMVLVTGASSGIGEAFAYKLAARGAKLILTARTESRLQQLAAELATRYQVETHVIAMDLATEGAAQRLTAAIGEKSLVVDLLINNAGFGKWTEFLSESLETYNRMLALNIAALTQLTYLCLPGMLARGQGGVSNVASTAAFQPIPYQAVYAASKAYVLHFTEALNGEYGERRVRCMALCPGNTSTRFMQVANANTEGMPFSHPDEVVESALLAYARGSRCHIHGVNNTLLAMLPRVLSRGRVVKIVAGMFRQRVVTT